ncbi:MAG TPA: HK97 family phage prohead protease [Spirochaetia bacterium]|nr:HK97 family phage prohead protease [Spirochaetia bacterium]
MVNELEERVIPMNVAELRATQAEDGKMIVEGYAIVYNQETVLYDDGMERDVEIVMPGAATNVLKTEDQRYLWNHKREWPLARKSIGTLSTTEDQKGVPIRAEIVNNQYGRDFFETIRTGLVDGQSFAFRVAKDRIEITMEEKIRVFRRFIAEFSTVPEFSAVTFPQYEQTTLGARTRNPVFANRSKAEASVRDSRTAVQEVLKDCRENLETMKEECIP